MRDQPRWCHEHGPSSVLRMGSMGERGGRHGAPRQSETEEELRPYRKSRLSHLRPALSNPLQVYCPMSSKNSPSRFKRT